MIPKEENELVKPIFTVEEIVGILSRTCNNKEHGCLFIDRFGGVSCLACDGPKPKKRKETEIWELRKLCHELNREWYEEKKRADLLEKQLAEKEAED